MKHDLSRKPVSTFRDHALNAPPRPVAVLNPFSRRVQAAHCVERRADRNWFDPQTFQARFECGCNLAADLSEVLFPAALSHAGVRLLNWRSF